MIGLLAALAATQLLGWATTFYIPGVLGDSVHEATGLSREEFDLALRLVSMAQAGLPVSREAAASPQATAMHMT